MLRDRYLEAMSEAAATVSVVTTDGPAGRAGVTVSAMCSVSADPPTILVCVHHLSPACEAIRENGAFCVNVLGDGQSAISDTFAGRSTTRWLRSTAGSSNTCARDRITSSSARSPTSRSATARRWSTPSAPTEASACRSRRCRRRRRPRRDDVTALDCVHPVMRKHPPITAR